MTDSPRTKSRHRNAQGVLRLSSRQIAAQLVEAVANGTGATIDPWGNVPTEGYVVGLEGIVDPALHSIDVPNWVYRMIQIHPGVYFGVWQDSETGKVYYDAVEIYEDLQEALRAGHSRGEIAIWDLANAVEIRVEY